MYFVNHFPCRVLKLLSESRYMPKSMNTSPSLVITALSGGLALVLCTVLVPYQISQQIQQTLSAQKVNSPEIIRPAYATGAIQKILVDPSSNLFGIKSSYIIQFQGTSVFPPTTISRIQITFPSGFFLGQVKLNPYSGYPNTNVTVSGQVVSLNLPNVIPPNEFLQYELFDVGNGYFANNQVSISTLDLSGNIVDGPTLSPIFILTPIGNGMLADNSVTANTIANGAVSINTTEYSSALVLLGPHSKGTATANCIPSQIATGGGFDTSSQLVRIIHSGKAATTEGWQVTAVNTSVTQQKFKAFAVCATITP
jgi:hypothetical protein